MYITVLSFFAIFIFLILSIIQFIIKNRSKGKKRIKYSVISFAVMMVSFVSYGISSELSMSSYTDEEKTETSVDSNLDTTGSEYKYATGVDWAEYSFTEKFIAVETILQSLEANGKTITADTYWFIDALNAYYGNGTEPGDTEKIVSVILLSGITGEVIR